MRPTDPAVAAAEQARAVPDAVVKAVTLTAAPSSVRIGDQTVQTYAFNGQVPGPQIRLAAGEVLKATVVNRLPQPLTMHWHGIALRNDMDGVRGVTQPAIKPGASFTYTFTVPDAGTFWYHPHTGVQLDRGLYGPLIVTPRAGDAVRDIPLMLDDWTDGMGATPEQVLARLRKGNGSGSSGGMGGMDHSGIDTGGGSMPGMGHPDTGDVTYPQYLVNGGTVRSPRTYRARAGERVRLRLINAGADTTFKVAVRGRRLTVVATDGFDVVPVTVDTLRIAMGERYDVEVTAPRSGGLALLAVADGKNARTAATLAVGPATVPVPSQNPAALDGTALSLGELHATALDALPARAPNRSYTVTLTGAMTGYDWGIRAPKDGGATLAVRDGDRVRLVVRNHTMMAHPIHLHGHTFQVVTGSAPGPRKDTVVVPSMGTVTLKFDADNPGQWMLHCHNAHLQSEAPFQRVLRALPCAEPSPAARAGAFQRQQNATG